MIKTFRGLIVDGGQDTIVLHTNDGSTGYRIVKFQGFPQKPGTADYESTLQIWKVEQTNVPTSTPIVDFNDNTLLGALIYEGRPGSTSAGVLPATVIFDNEIFNQDIYITHTEAKGSESFNYYIELEQMRLDLNESTVATLKDIRNIKRTATG